MRRSEPDMRGKKKKISEIPVQPLFENVLTVRKKEEKYSGLLHIPDTAAEKTMGAQVVAIGPDVKHIKTGNFVLVGKYAGAEVVFEGVEYTILRESEILGIVLGGGK